MGRGQDLLDGAREGDRRTVEKIIAQITRRSGPFPSLRRGAGVNVQDDNGYTPLHHACLLGHLDIVHLLLSVDASPCIVDREGATPLHLAAFKGRSEVVRMLLAHKNPPVNIDQQTLKHETALLWAAQFGYDDVVEQLIARGADVTIRNSNDDSALDLAAHYGWIGTVKLLLRVRPQLVDQYRASPMRDSIYFNIGTTPLHRAAKQGKAEVVEALIDAGVDPNIRSENGTALHEAARFARANVVRVLLRKGADLKPRDRKGKTVYDVLTEYSDEATKKVREVIREFVTQKSSYDSEEDVPPFPVAHDYSPTAPVMAPKTQKMFNKNDSLLSPPSSSLTKSHPQSFVKKLASKCLGLKAKFNSAPNISNNAGTDSEIDITSKSANQKSNTNTLLIGNSKFFKILSKKEESGEIVCNHEFDTISLDRLGTLNRDSVVNRSNRSCPGFKTSLPNISENNELSDPESIAESVVITELNCDTSDYKLGNINEAINYNPNINIFEPRERASIISSTSAGSANLINECYESYEFDKSEDLLKINSFPRPVPRPNATSRNNNGNTIYENVSNLRPKPTPAARTHLPVKLPLDEVEKNVVYENISVLRKPEPPKRTILPSQSGSSDRDNSRSVSRSSTVSSDSLVDETNLEDIFLSQKSKSFRHGQVPSYSSDSYKSDVRRTRSTASDSSDMTEASAIENVDCSADGTDDKAIYLSMTGTLPSKKSTTEKKKVLFRHKTFTNIEVDRNSVKVKDLPQWNNEFLRETLAHYHIRGTGHCIYNAPTVQEFMDIFNRDTLYKDVPPFSKVPNDKRDSYFETAICFCKPRPPKHHNSAEDLLERVVVQDSEEKVSIDLDALKSRREIFATSFKCFCDSGNCTFHSTRRESLNDLVVKFSAIKRSISTPDITLVPSFSSAPRTSLPKILSVPNNLEEPYAVVSVEDIIQKNRPQANDDGEGYLSMSHHSTLSSNGSRMYSIKDIAEVISLNKSSSTASTLSNASDMHLPVRKSSSSEYSGHWSLQSCNSNVTIKSDASFKTCLEESSDDGSDGTLHSDDESDTETIKSEISTVRRPWVHSDSFRFGANTRPEIDTIVEESQSSFEEKFESMSSKFESGISVEGSESSSSEGEDDSGVPRGGDVSLGASLERGSVSGGVRSGSGRRRWDELEGTSEGDALSLSSAASSCAPLHLAHHHDYSKVSPTPPKKPPRRNLSVSPTHANSPSSGYSYELRVHARSQDDLDDIQGAKHYLKHGRSVDHYVDSKLSYSEYEENHNSPRVAPIPNPRPSLKQRSQPVAITAMYENVAVKEQNPRRKLRRNNFNDNSEPRMTARKYSHQERSSLESLLDDQSMNSPSDCERYYDGPRADIPLSPTHYEQPPTPDHPPPTARQAENSIHERIRPLSQLIMEVVEEIRIRKKSQGDVTNS